MLWDPFSIKKVAKKCNLWDRKQYTYALFTVDKVNYCGLEKEKRKKKRGKRGEENVDVQTKRSFTLLKWAALRSYKAM